MRKRQFTTIALAVTAAVLIPVLLYTAFQFVQRSEEEELVRSIYDRQLESLLLSVNQYCWDMTQALNTDLISQMSAHGHAMFDRGVTEQIGKFLQKARMVAGVLVTGIYPDTVLVWKSVGRGEGAHNRRRDIEAIDRVLRPFRSDLEKRVRRAADGYIQPVVARWNRFPSNPQSLIVFPAVLPGARAARTGFIGLFIDDRAFVREVVARKFSEMDKGNLDFAVQEREAGTLLLGPVEDPGRRYEKREALWILPHLDLLVKLRGRTLADMSKARSERNLALLVLVNVILIAGFAYLLKNISREMALAQMKTDFVANVSHELRTPLSLIHMYAETLELGRVPGEERKTHYYRIIVNETHRLTRLINNILEFSKIEQRKKDFRKTWTNLRPIALSVLDMYRFHLQQLNFEVTQDLDSDTPEVFVDADAVSQALVNLLDNAVKFSREDRRIHLSLKRFDGHVVLSVQDHGIGISDQEQTKVFEKFYRARSGITHATPGSGLGLSLVKHVLEVHGGRIALKSQPGVGSVFSMVFPIHPEEIPQ